MWTRLLNRLFLAAVFFAGGAFGAVLLWVLKHRRRAPPFDGSIFDPGLGHWVIVAGSACALIGFVGRDVMGDRLRRSVSKTYGVDLPARPATGLGERLLVVTIALAATAAWYVWRH